MTETVQAFALAQDLIQEIDDGLTTDPEFRQLCRQAAAEGSVLLRNQDFFPIRGEEEVALFGRCQIDTFYVGYGSGGDIRPPYRVSIADGLIQNGMKLNQEVLSAYQRWCEENKPDDGLLWGQWPMNYEEMPLEDSLIESAAKKNRKAIMVIGRAAGEDRESLPEKGSWYLTDEEEDILRRLKRSFDKVAVVMNCGTIMDTSFATQLGLDGLLYIWQGGQEAGNAVYDVVSGAVSPSGKLTDTVAELAGYPSNDYFGNQEYNNYTEDVYVGYRFFETFAKEKVQYPFGYGLSYTTFSIVADDVSDEAVTFHVTNTGNEAGREVAQIYAGAPQGSMGKPERVLVDFVKTRKLKPGESQSFTRKLRWDLAASYDDQGVTGNISCWVLEKGDYPIYIGSDVRSAKEVYVRTVDKTMVLEQCEEACAPVTEFDRMVNRDGNIAFEQVPQRTVSKRERILNRLPETIPYTGDKGYRFGDVVNGKVSMDDFVAQLTEEELEVLTRGHLEGMYSSLAVEGNAGTFGATEPSLREKGIPVICTNDGPSGVRLQAHSTLLPNGVILASTFDVELVEAIGRQLGKEVVERGSMVLLAPGMNIHRHPLCGRNFEYFSEDPVLTGLIGAAYVAGVQSAGASATVKHFACNNQESNRFLNDTRISERALREIYLQGFRICIEKSQPDCVMTSYNKINGEFNYNNYDLVAHILRREWGFTGCVITDWWIVRSKCNYFEDLRDQAYRVRAQVDVFMPGSDRRGEYAGKVDGSIAEALASKEGITLGEVQNSAKNVLELGKKHELRKKQGKYEFTDAKGSFHLKNAQRHTGLYFPLASDAGLKSAISPNLGGDAKTDQNHFLFEPVSVDNLHNNRSGRNFWCIVDDKGVWSATGNSAQQNALAFTQDEEPVDVEAGFMWHKTSRSSDKYGLKADITSFVPVKENMEIHQVVLKNTGNESVTLTPVAAIPIYGRSADNIRDHRHVTSLLHRITVEEDGVLVNPTLSFDERGHQCNDTLYFVKGIEEDGGLPESFFPTVVDFIGEGGSLEWPEAVICNRQGESAGYAENGQEALGGIRFETITLEPGQTREYTLFAGCCGDKEEAHKLRNSYQSKEDVQRVLEETKQYWKEKVNVEYRTGDTDFNQFMNWISFQPELRRIFGCSFLPHHDYGKGGRGWRDLWQDCLALLLMNPDGVREMLLGNFAGVRVDGTNATIIGEKTGEFKADRNSITRVWMDHGVWPFLTTKLYMDQTGDYDLLKEKIAYFKDRQIMRGTKVDDRWTAGQLWQTDEAGEEYRGTVLEHLLLQNLTAFWEVGEHNHIRLRDADWNDALDLAGKRGESVAFSNAYASNLLQLADILDGKAAAGETAVELLQEIEILLRGDATVYDDIGKKTEILEEYLATCQHFVSGKTKSFKVSELAQSLREKGTWIQEHIRKTEWIEGEDGKGWYNGYYDNHGNALEGKKNGKWQMMLTAQVFSIMGGTATDEQIPVIAESADTYLYDEKCGGYRLNTDFDEVKMDMGRMFGFAYGEKENGAVFSHMAVMYANALYQRGFAKEGYKSLAALYRQAMNFDKSHIYPGIPEYFGKGGRGLYHYLTGAASWYMLTVVNQMFGVRGEQGNLVVEPKLLAEQFGADGKASLSLLFAGKRWNIEIDNPNHAEYGAYAIKEAVFDGQSQDVASGGRFVLSKDIIDGLDSKKEYSVKITLA